MKRFAGFLGHPVALLPMLLLLLIVYLFPYCSGQISNGFGIVLDGSEVRPFHFDSPRSFTII